MEGEGTYSLAPALKNAFFVLVVKEEKSFHHVAAGKCS
jgi:hypothetical protein